MSSPRPGAALLLPARCDQADLPDPLGISEAQRLQPQEHVLPHLPGGVVGEGDGEDVAQVVPRVWRGRGGTGRSAR